MSRDFDGYPQVALPKLEDDRRKVLRSHSSSMMNPFLEPLDKFGSFVDDEKITDETRPKPDRLRISLVFKNERLKQYATENLETHLVDARKDLMVHQFLSSVIEEC